MIESMYLDSLQLLPHSDSNPHGVTSVDGLGSPSPRQDVHPRSRAHGSTDYTAYYSSRVISLSGFTYGATMSAANTSFDLLKAAMALGSDHTLKMLRIGQTDDETMVVRVASELAGIFAGASNVVKWSVDLLAADPRIYGLTTRTDVYDPTSSPGSGLMLPLVFPLEFVGSSSSHLTLTNQGNFNTPPVFTIEGPIVNPILDNDTTGKSFYTSGLTMSAGDSIVVDMASRLLTVGGVNRLDYVDAALSYWFELQPGINLIRLRGSGMAAAQTSLAAAFHDARI